MESQRVRHNWACTHTLTGISLLFFQSDFSVNDLNVFLIIFNWVIFFFFWVLWILHPRYKFTIKYKICKYVLVCGFSFHSLTVPFKDWKFYILIKSRVPIGLFKLCFWYHSLEIFALCLWAESMMFYVDFFIGFMYHLEKCPLLLSFMKIFIRKGC